MCETMEENLLETVQEVDNNVSGLITEYQDSGKNELSLLNTNKDKLALSNLRRKNLRPYLKHGMVKKIADALGYSSNYFSQVVSIGSNKIFTSTLARNVEEFLTLPKDFLDKTVGEAVIDGLKPTKLVRTLASSILIENVSDIDKTEMSVIVQGFDSPLESFYFESPSIIVTGYETNKPIESLNESTIDHLLFELITLQSITFSERCICTLFFGDELTFFELKRENDRIEGELVSSIYLQETERVNV
jgi:hypothetical protein